MPHTVTSCEKHDKNLMSFPSFPPDITCGYQFHSVLWSGFDKGVGMTFDYDDSIRGMLHHRNIYV